jgi:hypothetical protein
LTLATAAQAAPAPLPRCPHKQNRLQHGQLVGIWTLHWHGAKGAVTLSPDGGYRCKWCGLEFVGTWKLSEGRVVIRESYRPSDAQSWHTYSVMLGPGPSGRPAAIRLERAR